MMKNKKSRSVIFRSIKEGVSESDNLGTNITTVKNSQKICPPFKYVVTYNSRYYSIPDPDKDWSEYLTERPIVDGDSLKLKFRNTPFSKPNIVFVKKIDGVQNPAGIFVRVFFIPKDKKVEDMIVMLDPLSDFDECFYGTDRRIGDEKVVVGATTTTIKDPSEFPSNLSEYLDHNVKNNGYSVGGNKRLYIIIELAYRDVFFAFYVD